MTDDKSENHDNLPEIAYRVTQENKTEKPYSGDLLTEDRDGTYRCVVCGQPLFSSEAKFDSGTGWPSFSEAKNNENLYLKPDNSLGQKRTEVQCGQCEAHLGHVFPDGPTDESASVPATGKRFCINSAALEFTEDG